MTGDGYEKNYKNGQNGDFGIFWGWFIASVVHHII
jgi:hypothetical protein